jgi:hypothetical protein
MCARIEAKAKPATVQKELAALRRMFTLAEVAGLVRRAPKFPTLEIRNARQGFFEDRELQAVLAHLPEYLRPPCYSRT